MNQMLMDNIASKADQISCNHNDEMITWTYDVDLNVVHFFKNEVELIETVPIQDLQN